MNVYLQIQIKQKNERIEELEEALRESVRITAQREMDMAELQAQIDASKTAVSLFHIDLFFYFPVCLRLQKCFNYFIIIKLFSCQL